MNSFKPTPIAYNGVHWICGLQENELGPSRRCSEDINDLCVKNELYYQANRVGSKEEFFSLMQAIADGVSEDGYKPILFLDFHGDITSGLVISNTDELISWGELFHLCQRINIATNNNLFVIAAACFGFNAIKPMKIDQPTPFNMLLAPEEEITVGEIERGLLPFFKKLFETNDVNVAQSESLASMRLYHCERLLARVLTQYYRNACMGKGKKDRIERLLSEYRSEKGIGKAQTISEVRAAFKESIRNGTNQEFF